MSTSPDMAERHGRVLAELSELGLGLARDLQARALAAEDVKTAADLGLAFHRIARSVRQTLALEARLERDRERAAREAAQAAAEAAAAEPRRTPRVARRLVEVRAAVERVICAETEGEE